MGLISCSNENNSPNETNNQPESDKISIEEFYELDDFELIEVGNPSSESEVEPEQQILTVEPEQETEPELKETTEEPVQDEIFETEEDPIQDDLFEPEEYLIIPQSEPALLTTETLLYDFDYLSRILEENYPFYGAARRKFGIDLQRQTALARTAVENLDATGNHSRILREFSDILSGYIVAPMRNMGHMIGLWSGGQSYKIQLALMKWDGSFPIQWYPNLYARYLLGMFTSPTAIRYYGNPFDSEDIESFIQSVLFTPVPNNVTFDIIQPDSIAYIHMRDMDSASIDIDGELIAAFVETIGNFDHLIIDLRGNRGGSASAFLQNIIAPLIDEPASLFYYVFFKGGQHNLMFDELYYRDLQWQSANGLVLHADAPRFHVGDILPSLTHANAADFADISYGFKREITVTPSANRWEFKGKIWILIDGRSISATEISAALAKESGFATLVGESTGGMFGGYTAAFIGLPNTGAIIRYDYGYVTDLNGRAIEEFGVAPNIYNRPGMDALETVLALISEGNY
ncbi:MAG: S41 family peptidase [Oscillospiraceae bacterium]|nr:S41 family peptidase [Oscillospiraceae bacterium]